MEFAFKVETVLTLEHQEGWATSKHVSTDFNLFIQEGMDKEVYLTDEDLPTAEGAKILSNVLSLRQRSSRTNL